jgi:hypothetical protein
MTVSLAQRVFDYSIQPTDRGWRWAAFRPDGDIAESGIAATRSVAAALIIRALTRTCTPSGVAEGSSGRRPRDD